ncbi:MAG: sporulation integral membrane protein YtvI [Clostridia bacterium]|nr:sporulation integral membrane protein YtvI [Clostridia bacterium]
MNKIELRRGRIINIVYLAIILGLAYLFVRYCFWIFFPFLLAFLLAVAVQKPANFLVRKTKIKKGLASTVLILSLFVIVGGVISLLGMKLVDVIRNTIDFITAQLTDLPSLIDDIKYWVISTAEILPDKIEAKFVTSASNWLDLIRDKSVSEIAAIIADSASGKEGFSLSAITTPLSGLWSTAKRIPSVFVAIVISILSSCFMASDYDWITSFIKNQLSAEHKRKLSISKRVVFKSLGKLIRSYALIICITGTEIFIGLNILSLLGLYNSGNIIIISVIVALLDILPVLGTGTFMIPWAVYSLITNKIGLAVGLFIVYATIYVVRQVIEPKIVGGTVGLPPFITLMGMYVGSQLFGFIGIFLVPIMIIIVKLLNDEGVIHLWKPTEEAETAPAAEGSGMLGRLFKK